MPDRAIPWVERQTGLALAREPASGRCASRCARKVLVITGGPGVGKTTLVNAILTVLRAKQVGRSLCAPRPAGRPSA